MDRLITVFVRDERDRPLPGASIDYAVEGKPLGGVDASEGRGSFMIPGPREVVDLTARYADLPLQTARLGKDIDDWTFTFPVIGGFSSMGGTILTGTVSIAVILLMIGGAFYAGLLAGILPLALGIVLLTIALVLAFGFKDPTLLQAQLIRSTFALGAGGLASQIPGWLNVDVKLGTQAAITAGGAISVYIITFFFVPAKDT